MMVSEHTKERVVAPVKNHPNASLATSVGAIATVVVWIAGVCGASMSAEVGTAFATLLIAASLVVGKKGIKGLMKSIWDGDDDE